MMKIILTLVSLAALTSACQPARVTRASREALADYHATEAQHLRANYYKGADLDMTCPITTPSGEVVGIPSHSFSSRCN